MKFSVKKTVASITIASSLAAGCGSSRDGSQQTGITEPGDMTDLEALEFTNSDELHARWSVSPEGADLELDADAVAKIGAKLIAKVGATELTGIRTRELASNSGRRVLRVSVPPDVLALHGGEAEKYVQFYAEATGPGGKAQFATSDLALLTRTKFAPLDRDAATLMWSSAGPPSRDARLEAMRPLVSKATALQLAAAGIAAQQAPVHTLGLADTLICFQEMTTYPDSRAEQEDFWPERTATPRTPSFMDVVVDGTPFRLDLFGCLPHLQLQTGAHTFVVKSRGALGNSTLLVGTYNPDDTDGCEGCSRIQAQQINWNLPGNGTFTITFTPPAAESKLNVYPAAMLGLIYNFLETALQGINNPYEYRIQVRAGVQGSATSATGGFAQIRLADKHQDSKFTITHELGHGFMMGGGGLPPGWFQNLAFSGDVTPCGTGGGGHAFNSVEYAGGALNEGYANFFSAIAFNDSSPGADCWFEGRDCSGDLSFAESYMKTTCSGAPFDNLGVEWDWTRTLWDVRTHTAGGGFQPTMTDIRNLLNITASHGRSSINFRNAYSALDGAANEVGNPLNAVWDRYKVNNGINVAFNPNGP